MYKVESRERRSRAPLSILACVFCCVAFCAPAADHPNGRTKLAVMSGRESDDVDGCRKKAEARNG